MADIASQLAYMGKDLDPSWDVNDLFIVHKLTFQEERNAAMPINEECIGCRFAFQGEQGDWRCRRVTYINAGSIVPYFTSVAYNMRKCIRFRIKVAAKKLHREMENANV